MENYYSIGRACKICDITPRTLRYYEEIGLVTPDKTDQDNGYRYYTISTLRYVQAIRYLVDQGFSLDDIQNAMAKDDIQVLRDLFMRQIHETQNQIDFYHQRMDSLKDWCGLLLEGEQVLKHKKFRPYVRYFPEELYFVYERETGSGELDSDAYIETEYFTRSKQDGHSMVDVGGAFNLMYDSYEERMSGTYQKQSLMQVIYEKHQSMEGTRQFGGFNVVTAYHIGNPKGLTDTYRKLLKWADQHCFTLRGDCIERKVIDVYSTKDVKKFVTEILLPIDEDAEAQGLLHQWRHED
jgi:DNA-binding transcriptional MerR regulator